MTLNPETIIFNLIQASARAEHKIDEILENQKVMTERINKRETEIEELDGKHVDLDKRVVKIESTQHNNWKWLLAVGTLAAGIGAIAGVFL